MKITKTDFDALKAAIEPWDTAANRAVYASGNFHNAHNCKDVNKRYRWDLLHASRLKIGDGKGMPGLPLYAYLNDDHIDTALRSIVKPL